MPSSRHSSTKHLKHLCLGALCFIIISLLAPHSSAQIPAVSLRHNPITEQDARNWCDTTPLHTPEGIYAMPSLNTLVLVKAVKSLQSVNPGFCEMIALAGPNLLLPPGQVIGYISPTGDPAKYKITVYTNHKAGGLSRPKEYSAHYHHAQASISIEMPRRHLSFNFLSLIPRLRRLLSFSSTDPAKNLPVPLIKIYPRPHSPTSSLLPRYF